VLVGVGNRGNLKFSRWQTLGLILCVYSVCFGFIASSLRLEYGFPLDDSYITQTIARNFADTGALGVYPGKPSPGATSLLWVLIQAVNFKVIHADPVMYNVLLSWIFLISIGFFLLAIAVRDGLSWTNSIGFAITPALCGSFLWLGMIGMESLLFVLLTVSATYFWLEPGSPAALLTGLSIGLLAVTRPDGLLLGMLLLLLFRVANRTFRELILAASAWGGFVLGAIASNLYESHSIMPGTMKGRAWLYFGAGGPHSFASIFWFLFKWIIKPSMNFSLWYAHPPAVYSLGVLSLVSLPVVLSIVGILWLLRSRLRGVSIIVILAFGHFLIFLVMFPSWEEGGRYQPLNLLLLLPAMLFGTLRSALGILPKYSRFVTPAVSTAFLIASGSSLNTWRVVTIEGIAHIRNTHYAASRWLATNAPYARVAAFDFGRISFERRSGVLDIAGLTDPSYYPYMTRGDALEYAERKHVEFVVLPSDDIPRVLGFTHSLTARARFCTPRSTWMIAWNYTRSAAQCQIISRIENTMTDLGRNRAPENPNLAK
jgi:hypothetical protein